MGKGSGITRDTRNDKLERHERTSTLTFKTQEEIDDLKKEFPSYFK